MGFERIERGELQFERQRYRGGFVVALIWGVAIIPHLMLRAKGGQGSFSIGQWPNLEITWQKWKQFKDVGVVFVFFPQKKSLAKLCMRTMKTADEAPIFLTATQKKSVRNLEIGGELYGDREFFFQFHFIMKVGHKCRVNFYLVLS